MPKGLLYILVGLMALCLVQPLGLSAPAHASEKKAEGKKDAKKTEGRKPEKPQEGSAIGYGGPHLRLSPIMVPYQSSDGVRYQPIIIEVEVVGAVGEGEKLDTEGNLRQKQACFTIPLIHDKLLEYLFKAKLTSEDFVGEKRDVLQKNLFDALIAYVGKGYYIKLTILGDDPPALDPASQTLSVQCR